MLSLLWLLFLLQISRHFAHSIYVLNCVQCVHQSINECASIFAKPHYFFSSFWLVGGYTFSLSLPLILLQFSFLCVGWLCFFSWSENALRPDCFIYLCNIHFGSYTIHRGFHIYAIIIDILTILCTDPCSFGDLAFDFSVFHFVCHFCTTI